MDPRSIPVAIDCTRREFCKTSEACILRSSREQVHVLGTSKTHLHADGDGTGVVRDGGKWMGVEMGGDREGP